MGKASQDVPSEMRPFFKELDAAAYHHQYSEVFNDFLVMTINAFSYPGSRTEADRDQALKKYKEKEIQGFRGMFRELFIIQNKMIIDAGKGWYDPFGSIYEAISSSHKASGLGQFFTPAHVVDLMTAITIVENKEPYLTIQEPCAGSGRMILSCHAKNPLCFYHATDVDGMCYRMTALNMALHNASGVVYHGNSLSGEIWDAYIVDRAQIGEKQYFPVIKPATKQEADEWWWGISEYCRIMKGQPRPEPVEEKSVPMVQTVPPVSNSKKKQTNQLTLFS